MGTAFRGVPRPHRPALIHVEEPGAPLNTDRTSSAGGSLLRSDGPETAPTLDSDESDPCPSGPRHRLWIRILGTHSAPGFILPCTRT